MRIVEPSIEILTEINAEDMLRKIEQCGRVCYKSEDKIADFERTKRFVKNRIKVGHESILEHQSISVRVVCDRGISHEIVRHRLASYSMQSTRFNGKSDELEFIKPGFFDEDSNEYTVWDTAVRVAEFLYGYLLDMGCTPEKARSVLPHSLKTELIMTMNIREWRHFLRLRTAPDAHPQMREIATMVLNEFKSRIPVLFDDISAGCGRWS